jgi:ferritin-like metal-binding protein YciE
MLSQISKSFGMSFSLKEYYHSLKNKFMATKSKQSMVKPSEEAAADLKDLFEEQVKDIYWAEKALVKALPKMAKNASSEQLVEAINNHLEETKMQVGRLEDVFKALGKKAQAKKCEAMQGLIDEGNSIVEETEPGPVRDAGIIGACQKIEHYEIATYGTLSAFAKLLGEQEVEQLLTETLDEEKNADEVLTEVAESGINWQANEEDEEEEEEDEDDDDDDEEQDDDEEVKTAGKTTANKSRK